MHKILSLLLFLSFSLLLVNCGDDKKESSKMASKSKTTPKKKVADGSKIYKINCVVCHGTRGDMGASGAFNLTTSELTLEERVAVITNGRNTMIAFKDVLKPEEIEAVAKFSMTLKK